MADYTIKLNLSTLRRLNKAAVAALEQTAEAVHTDLVQSQTMPRKTGNLQNESTFVDTEQSALGVVRIVSSTPYARRLYYHPEYNFHREPWEYAGFKRENGTLVFDTIDKGDGNPNAGGEWFSPYLADGTKANFAGNAFARLYRKEAGT